MNTAKSINIAIRTIALFTLLSSATYAGPHSDLPTCYIDVHSGCFNTKPHCSQEDYEAFLENCDTAYPNAAPANPKPFSVFKMPNQQMVASVAYKQKMRQLNLRSKRAGIK
jgi:hypothetical protein